jgi:hypothetical protein
MQPYAAGSVEVRTAPLRSIARIYLSGCHQKKAIVSRSHHSDLAIYGSGNGYLFICMPKLAALRNESIRIRRVNEGIITPAGGAAPFPPHFPESSVNNQLTTFPSLLALPFSTTFSHRGGMSAESTYLLVWLKLGFLNISK